jgi:hypothetical protein
MVSSSSALLLLLLLSRAWGMCELGRRIRIADQKTDRAPFPITWLHELHHHPTSYLAALAVLAELF